MRVFLRPQCFDGRGSQEAFPKMLRGGELRGKVLCKSRVLMIECCAPLAAGTGFLPNLSCVLEDGSLEKWLKFGFSLLFKYFHTSLNCSRNFIKICNREAKAKTKPCTKYRKVLR